MIMTCRFSRRLVLGLAVLALGLAQDQFVEPPTARTPPELNQTAVSASNQTNATLLSNQSTSVAQPFNQTDITVPANVTAPINQTNAAAIVKQTNVTMPFNETIPAAQPPQNITGNVTVTLPTSSPAVRNQTTVAPATVMPTADGGVVTPTSAQQQTTGPGQRPPGLNVNNVVAMAGWNGTIVDGGETLILKLPRSQELNLRIKNIFVPGAGCAATFRPLSDGNVNFMCELLLLDDEVSPVLRYALSAGLEAMALHTHFLFDQPRTYFLHLHSAGVPPDTTAAVLRNITNTIIGVRASPPSVTTAPLETHVNTLTLDPIQAALLSTGATATKQDDGSVFITSPPLTCTVMGYNTSHTLGCQSVSTFAGSDADAIVYGELCSNQYNLQRVVINALLQNLMVTAIVNHFVGDNPEIMFVHFWGRGPAPNLAGSLAQVVSDSYRTQ